MSFSYLLKLSPDQTSFSPFGSPKAIAQSHALLAAKQQKRGFPKAPCPKPVQCTIYGKACQTKKSGHRHTCDATQKDLYKLHLKWYSFHKTMANISLFYGKISEVLKSPFFPPSIILHPKQSRVSGQDR